LERVGKSLLAGDSDDRRNNSNLILLQMNSLIHRIEDPLKGVASDVHGANLGYFLKSSPMSWLTERVEVHDR
jgi:hypothetical protein